ncbi:hypothetical protein TRICI_001658 [Trichomonascus ciferrii]|uniref:tRNA-splicing endonuclease subunit Sen2 n=1 Tax=Trichomonascus ciferrii TaxID=44093 RepID=A0A642V9B2_9ASCO|nr:hypothetical protein TRICI_001658 [Trichomonascus ciferrii]
MGKKQSLNSFYKYPLPVAVKPLPQVIPHNPLSIVYCLWEYLFPTSPKSILCHGKLTDRGFVVVDDEYGINTLWSMGFFGKGTFSRSEPTWFVRTARRLGLSGGEKLTAEDVTSARRQQRKKFKQERAKQEKQELERLKALENGQPDPIVDADSIPPPSEKQLGSITPDVNNSVKKEATLNERDSAIVSNGELVQLEYLQLMPSEALFLSVLGCLEIDKCTNHQELFEYFIASDDHFLYDYIVYHHFRSRGWCVRSGVKFGTDYLIYRRGPPFSHAEFGILVMPTNEAPEKDWWWNTSVGRVVGGVKKTLVFCYVTLPESREGMSLEQILKASFVREVVYRRWVPTRNRD